MPEPTVSPELLDTVANHYHQTLCGTPNAQRQLARLGITDADVIKAFRIGYADRSLLRKLPGAGDVRDQLENIGLVTARGEALAGCLVVPLLDPQSGQPVAFCGLKASGKEKYAPSTAPGILNFQAAKSSSEVILVGSVLDALALWQAGIRTSIPVLGMAGRTGEHIDIFKREGVQSISLLLPTTRTWRGARERIRARLVAAGVSLRIAELPRGLRSVTDVVRMHQGKAGPLLRECLGLAEPVPSASATPNTGNPDGRVRVQRADICYVVQPYPILLGRLRAVVRAEKGELRHIDTLDLYASRARVDFARRVSEAFAVPATQVEGDLLAVLADAERFLSSRTINQAAVPPPMSDVDRAEALALLRRPELLDQVAADMEALGYVGEDVNKRLLYLVSISRKLPSPLSAVILSQSAAGKSGLSDVVERLTPEEDVLFLTRLSPQSLFYSAPELLNQKLIVIEERAGSAEVDYPIRAIQSRGRLTVATPTKDAESGETKTRTFCVKAQVAFIESTTDTAINPENGSRCFEISMDESQEQTKRIHDRQRLMKTEAGLELRRDAQAIIRRHWNAQRLLEPLPVLIPYAQVLTFPTTWMRTRRDNARFLNLIEVSAFLHQYQRERSNGVVVASVDDYRVAYALSASVLAETLTDLKRPFREALDRIRPLAQERQGALTRREIREALQLPDTTVRRWLKELVELEYLTLVDAGRQGQGKTSRYAVVDRGALGLDVTIRGLLTPEQLETATSPQTAKRSRRPSSSVRSTR